jgi:hypothetical protein
MCLKLSRLTVISHFIQNRQTLRWVLLQASDVKNCKQYAHLSLKTGDTHTIPSRLALILLGIMHVSILWFPKPGRVIHLEYSNYTKSIDSCFLVTSYSAI